MRRYLNPTQYDSTGLDTLQICTHSSCTEVQVQYYSTEIDTFPITTLSLANNLANLTDVITDNIGDMSQCMYNCQSDKKGDGAANVVNATELAKFDRSDHQCIPIFFPTDFLMKAVPGHTTN